MQWAVHITKRAAKQCGQLPMRIQEQVDLLAKELEVAGPWRANWSHFGRLKGQKGERFHCHVGSGRPTYVACWEVIEKKIRILEVYYVGTHEKAPY